MYAAQYIYILKIYSDMAYDTYLINMLIVIFSPLS